MSGIRSYRRRTVMLPLLVAGYVAIAIQPLPRSLAPEIFPFFNWSLFSNSSPVSMDSVALIHSANGVSFNEPRSLFDLPEVFDTAARRDIRFAKVLDRFAISTMTGDTHDAELARALIEDHFMRGVSDVDYTIAILRYDAVERYRTGKATTHIELGRFTKP